MTKAVQRRRGTNTQHSSFTGLEGEISVNTTNDSVHVHDGSTAGGFELARADMTNASINDTDNFSDASATTVASSESIKAYVDAQQDTVDTLAEVIALGNSTGGTDLVVTAGDAITTNTINETTAASGVTIDSVLLKDNGVTATNLTGTLQTAAQTNVTSLGTISSLVATTADIDGGTLDGATLGPTTQVVFKNVQFDAAHYWTNNAYVLCGTSGYRFNDSTNTYNNIIMADNGDLTVRGIGDFAGGLSTTSLGTSNLRLGLTAGDSIVSGGNYNTLVGDNAGTAVTTGDYNVALGFNAAPKIIGGLRNVAVGAYANQEGTSGSDNVHVGYAAGATTTTSSNNTSLGSYALTAVSTGANNLALGKDAGRTGSPGGNITTASNEILLGDENVTAANIQVDWTIASDQRDKTDFTALDLGLDFVKALAPVTYKWDKRSKYGDKTSVDYDLAAQAPDGTHKEDWLDIGFKAQEVEALEIAAGYSKDTNTNLVSSHTGDGKQMGLQYSKFVPILVKAIQEQQDLIESLTARITTLEG